MLRMEITMNKITLFNEIEKNKKDQIINNKKIQYVQ